MTKTLTLTLSSIMAAVLLFSPAHTPEEDEPGWNCATMGNLSCGEAV
jgi:hypothetical protein